MGLDSVSKKWLQNHLNDCVKFDEPMSKHTFLAVGGPADAYVTPRSMESLSKLTAWCRQNRIPYLIIGKGSNLLVKDNGIRGIVIALTKYIQKITLTQTQNNAVFVNAVAGISLQTLCSFALKRGLEGMNFALGIPGTVGGAIMMNAGTAGGSIANVIDSITVLPVEGREMKLGKKILDFDYRKLTWNREKEKTDTGPPIILEGCFHLRPSDPQKLKKEAEFILKTRAQRQPLGFASAGCFFKNPDRDETAGKLIEMAGLKGKRIGDAQVSSKHANFIINCGKASSHDILALMEIIQGKVSKMFDIHLEPEVKIVGS
ncbi:MAG: UDP-N-acetylmuramate dehydrogenase [Desulfobacterales bacterium]|nr:UDP-N-acetylmuramate dehydrogenase [Desulfobacterales bacterium]